MASIRPNVHLFDIGEVESQRVRHPKWPNAFWLILKALCLYYHRVIVKKRQCFQCHIKENNGTATNNRTKREGYLDSLALEYDSKSSARNDGEYAPLLEDQSRPPSRCEVCDILWWNGSGEPREYTDEQIGVGFWNHRGSGLLSTLMLLGAFSLIVYDVTSFMLKLWARPQLVLAILLKFTFYALIIIFPTLSLCAKLRSYFTTTLPSLSWTTALNVRYLVKRAQILDIGKRGMPGRPFLLLCTVGALFLSIYRLMIFAYLSSCGLTTPIIVTFLVGLLLTEGNGLSMYLVYFMRVSFQRQFALLTFYIKAHEGEYHLCNGAMHDLVEDYTCFRRLCNTMAFVMYPVMVFAVAGNVTFEFLLMTSCIAEDPVSWSIEKHVSILAWLDIVLVFSSFVIAIGGLQVEYLLNDFVINLSHLATIEQRVFWKTLIGDVLFLAKESYVFLITVILSFMSFFMAFNFKDQDTSDLTDYCNGTHYQSRCV